MSEFAEEYMKALRVVNQVPLAVEPVPEFHAENGTHKSERNWLTSAISARDLQHKEFPPIKFVVPGLIPEGLTLLVSRPKLGKSWLVLDLCIAVAAGRFTLGSLKPASGDVLYAALEDGHRRLQRRLRRLLPDGEWPDKLKLAPELPRANEGGIAAIEDWLKSVANPVLVVIDTLQKFRKPQGASSNTYADDYAALGELQRLASTYGVAVILVHHDRKMAADDVFDTVSGTQGLTGAADTIAIMKRETSGVTLHVRGRDVEEAEIALQFQKESCKWTILGDAGEIYRNKERGRVIAALKESPAGASLKVNEIMIAADIPNRTTADTLLHRMMSDAEIVRVGRGEYALPPQAAPDLQPV